MHAEAIRQHGADEDLGGPVLMALALHLGIALLLLVAGWLQPPPKQISVAGPVLDAMLVVSASDIAAAEQTAEAAPQPARRAEIEAAPPPQPMPAPRPQDAPREAQPAPQAPIPKPDTRELEAAARLALEQEQAREREEQEARKRQEQIDLTERKRQEEVEERQRLRRQELEALRAEREAAERRAKLEEARLRQLAERQATPAPAAQPTQAPAQVSGGNNGTDTDLAARYALAMLQTAQNNWNRVLAPERTRCQVEFTQIPGGEVIDVAFLACPFDAQGRESVERALRRTPMPYEEFKSVFRRKVQLTFCYPEEACR